MKGYELRCVSESKHGGWPEYIAIENNGELKSYGQLLMVVDFGDGGINDFNMMALRYRDALARNDELRTLVERKDKQIARLRGLLGL